MLKKKKAVSYFLVMVLVICTFISLNTTAVSAKTKKTYYSGTYVGKQKDVYKTGIVSKVKFTKKTMQVYGSLLKGKSGKVRYDSIGAKYCKKKKRSFKLAKNVKFYCSGGAAGSVRESRKKFVKTCKRLNKKPNGLGFCFIVKNGKVIRVELCS